ncbi:MAG: tetratricopeptide repeat protein [Bacteroidales bacterium]|nr:tetratricopeptide repeat protein [Bacteroidales bacterium]
MKKIILFISIIAAAFTVTAQDLQKQATEAYTKGHYAKAAELFETILKEKGESANLYYNLGNAYYKSDRVADAILNYEKALLLAPGDDDIRVNLEIAKQKTVDKITPVGTFLLTDWIHTIHMQMSSNGWAKSAIVLFLLFIVALFVYFFSGRVWMKKISFFGGIFVLLLSFFANYSAYSQKQALAEQSHAIIFSESVVAKSTPDDSGTDLFLMHQGAKVELKDSVDKWSQVALEDGNVGWIQNDTYKVIGLLK